MKSPLSISIAKLAGAAFVTGLLTLTSLAAHAATERYFKSIITSNSEVLAGSTTATPDSNVQAGATAVFSISITNCDSSACDGDHATTSSQKMGSATIAVPPGFSSVTSLSTSVSDTTKSWNASLVGTSIQLVADTGKQKLIPGESVTVSFSAMVPCDAGAYEWTTVGYNGTDYTTAYDLFGSQPTVEVTGSCQTFAGWQSGDYCTYGQGAWGTYANGNNPGSIRDDYFETVYPSGVSVGVGNYMLFTASKAVNDFLPGCKAPAALTEALQTDPQSICGQGPNTTGGIFGAQVLALKLNSDFNAADKLDSNLHDFGSIWLTDTGTSLDGQTIADILSAAEIALGGGALPPDYTFSQLNTLVDAINQAFSECEPSEWAQAHLMP